ADDGLQAVVGLRDRGAAEAVRLDDVAARLEVRLVDAPDDVGARQHEELVVALHVVGVVAEALAAVVGLAEPVALDHRAHRAVEYEDAAREQLVESRAGVGNGHGRLLHDGLRANPLMTLKCGWRRSRDVTSHRSTSSPALRTRAPDSTGGNPGWPEP